MGKEQICSNKLNYTLILDQEKCEIHDNQQRNKSGEEYLHNHQLTI